MSETHTTLLFLRKNDQLLLAMKKRGFGANRYNGVGGKILPGETMEEALIRECQEEINVTPLAYETVAEHNFYGHEDSFHMHVYAFICDEWEGEPIESEEMAPEWFNFEDIPYSKMWSDDSIWVPKVLEGKKVYGEFYFDKDDKVISHTLDEVTTLPHEKK